MGNSDTPIMIVFSIHSHSSIAESTSASNAIDYLNNMKKLFLIDIVLSVLLGLVVRTCARDAAFYKLNRKAKKEFINRHSLLCNLLRAYFPHETNAPRNMKYFQLFRVLNYTICMVSICCVALCCDKELYRYVFYAKIFLLYVPFIIYDIYVRLHGDFFSKRIDFDIFKNP